MQPLFYFTTRKADDPNHERETSHAQNQSLYTLRQNKDDRNSQVKRKGVCQLELSYLLEIDEKETKLKADALLKAYPRFLRIAGRKVETTMTQQLTFMPGSQRDPRTSEIELKVQKKVDAEKIVADINKAINAQDARSRNRLLKKYITNGGELYDYQIYAAENISEATYYRELGKAQIGFAEAFRYGELLTFENDRQKTDT